MVHRMEINKQADRQTEAKLTHRQTFAFLLSTQFAEQNAHLPARMTEHTFGSQNARM